MGRGVRKFQYTLEDVSWLLRVNRRELRRMIKFGGLDPGDFRGLVERDRRVVVDLLRVVVEQLAGLLGSIGGS